MTQTHPLWRAYELFSDEQVAAVTIAPRMPAPVDVVAPDPAWPSLFEKVLLTIRAALGERALRVEHVGSTAVPGLWAKPLIDVDLIVPDSSDEAAYVPALEKAGFELRVREPEWQQHRMLRGTDPVTNVHVFSPGAVEPQRHVAFRDWLVADHDDRERYAELKRDLATRGFTDVMHYNNHKAALIYDIYERIFAADPQHPHTPRPR